MTHILLQMSPIVLVIALILLARRPPVQAALAGFITVLILWILGVAAPLSAIVSLTILKDTMVLFLSTASVIVPGLAFVILVERGGAPQAIGAWVKELGWSPPEQIIFIVLGLAPLLEAMTGFGVSLIATVPLLIGLFSRQVGMKIALAGMVIMPWGTLGLATIIGALLTHIPTQTLGSHSALISAPVFLCMAAIALWQGGIRTNNAIQWLGLCAMSIIFSTVLYSVNHWIGPEISGVLAGLTVAFIGLLIAFFRHKRLVRWPNAAWPYLALLGVIIVLKAVFVISSGDGVWAIKGEHVSWKPLASPGLALLIVTIIMLTLPHTKAKFPWSELVRRAKFPVATIFLFLLLSQVMVNAGFLVEAQNALHSLSGISLAPTIAILGGIAGYVTGSNVGGNALVMPSIAALSTEYGPWLAAIANSAVGHGALGSLSILSLITGLAAASHKEEHGLIRFAFGLVVLCTMIVATTGVVLLYVLGGHV